MIFFIMRHGDRIPRVAESATLVEALEEMTAKDNLGLTLVVDRLGKLTGIVTDGDIRRVLLRKKSGDSAAEVLSGSVAAVMTRRPRIIDPESSAAEALRIMEVHGITSLAVVNHEDMPEGVIHLHDILGRGKFHL